MDSLAFSVPDSFVPLFIGRLEIGYDPLELGFLWTDVTLARAAS